MNCFEDPFNYTLNGNWKLSEGTVLNIDIQRCNNSENNCASETEIDDFIMRNQFIMFYNNHQYNQEIYKGPRIVQDHMTLGAYPLII